MTTSQPTNVPNSTTTTVADGHTVSFRFDFSA